MALLIDTDTIIYHLKGDGDIEARLRDTKTIPKSISIITYGELVYGARKSKRPQKNLATVYKVADLFPIISLGRSTMDLFGELKRNLEQTGERLDDMDLLIGATALLENLTLITC